jgi:excisionase family DNA binding protein
MPPEIQLELGLFVSPDVAVTRFADGEIRLKPKAPLITGGTKEAAKALGVSPKTIIRLIEDKQIHAWKPAKRKWRIDMTSVYDLLERSRAEGRNL